MPKTLKITNGPAKADLLRAVAGNELIAVLRTKDGLVEAHIEVVKESPSGNSFALAGTLQSFQLAGVRFQGTYDTEKPVRPPVVLGGAVAGRHRPGSRLGKLPRILR